jgi:hypothetical protein
MCTPVTPTVPYLLLGLQDVQWAVGNSRGARKLARTPHVNKKKNIYLRDKFLYLIYINNRFKFYKSQNFLKIYMIINFRIHGISRDTGSDIYVNKKNIKLIFY